MSRATEPQPQDEQQTERMAPERKPDITVTKVAAGALASVTAAVAGSQLGVAGTITGAALVSVVSTVGTAIYQHSFERTRNRVRRTHVGTLLQAPISPQQRAVLQRHRDVPPLDAEAQSVLASARAFRHGGSASPQSSQSASSQSSQAFLRSQASRPHSMRHQSMRSRSMPSQAMPSQPRPTEQTDSPATRRYDVPPTRRADGPNADGPRLEGRTSTPNSTPSASRPFPDRRLQQEATRPLRLPGTPGTPVRPAGPGQPPAQPAPSRQYGPTALTDRLQPPSEQAGAHSNGRSRLVRWSLIGGVAALLFLVGMLGLTGIELAAGHSLSGGPQGSTTVGLIGGQSSGGSGGQQGPAEPSVTPTTGHSGTSSVPSTSATEPNAPTATATGVQAPGGVQPSGGATTTTAPTVSGGNAPVQPTGQPSLGLPVPFQ